MPTARARWNQAPPLLAIGTTPVQRELLATPHPELFLVRQHEAGLPTAFGVEDVAATPRPAEDPHSTEVEEVKAIAAKYVHRGPLKSPGAEQRGIGVPKAINKMVKRLSRICCRTVHPQPNTYYWIGQSAPASPILFRHG
jgi:hypothetical protein